MEKSPEIGELCAALAKAQMSMEGARKDKTNPHFKAAYADIASVWEAIRDPLAAAGLAIMQWPRTVEGGVEIETILTHQSGQYISDILSMPCTPMNAHGIGSAITYGRRYALMAVVGVAPVDDDANGAVGAPGSAGAGTQFRPEGRRPLPAAVQRQDRPAQVAEAQRDGLTTNPVKPAAAPANGANATKRAMWCQDAMDGFKLAASKEALTEWWKTNVEKLAVIEESMPMLYEKLLVAYDAALEAIAAKVAA